VQKSLLKTFDPLSKTIKLALSQQPSGKFLRGEEKLRENNPVFTLKLKVFQGGT